MATEPKEEEVWIYDRKDKKGWVSSFGSEFLIIAVVPTEAWGKYIRGKFLDGPKKGDRHTFDLKDWHVKFHREGEAWETDEPEEEILEDGLSAYLGPDPPYDYDADCHCEDCEATRDMEREMAEKKSSNPTPKSGQIWQYNPGESAECLAERWRESEGAHFVIKERVLAGEMFKCRFISPEDSASPIAAHPDLLEKDVRFAYDRFTDGMFTYVGEQGDKPMTAPKRTKTLSKWTLAEKVIPESRLVLLYGPPGTGKTTAGNRIGRSGEMQVDNTATRNDGLLTEGTLKPVIVEVTIGTVYNITLTEETPAAELRGHYHMKGGDFVWQDGTGLMPFRNGGRLVLNEIDKASGDCLQFCHALLDDPDIAAITLPTGETVRPHKEFSVLATMNGEPEDLPEALRDRFTIRINIDMPHPKAIKSLPEDLQEPCKKSYSGFDGLQGVTFRTWKMFAYLRDTMGEDIAAQAVFGERARNILNTLRIGRG